MNSILRLTCVVFGVAFVTANAWAQENILATPGRASATPRIVDESSPGSYATARALFAATRSGEIPEAMNVGYNYYFSKNLGTSVYLILQKEYGLKKDRMTSSDESYHPAVLAELIQQLTLLELQADKDNIAKQFQETLNQAFGNPAVVWDGFNHYKDSRAIFTKFAAQYSSAVKEYLNLKREKEKQRQKDEQQRQKEFAERQQQAAIEEQKVADEERKQQELSDAREASRKAEEDAKKTAMNDALTNATHLREQPSSETLVSPTDESKAPDELELQFAAHKGQIIAEVTAADNVHEYIRVAVLTDAYASLGDPQLAAYGSTAHAALKEVEEKARAEQQAAAEKAQAEQNAFNDAKKAGSNTESGSSHSSASALADHTPTETFSLGWFSPKVTVRGKEATFEHTILATFTAEYAGVEVAREVYRAATKRRGLIQIVVSCSVTVPGGFVDKYGKSVDGPLTMGSITVSDLDEVRRYEDEDAYATHNKMFYAANISGMDYSYLLSN